MITYFKKSEFIIVIRNNRGQILSFLNKGRRSFNWVQNKYYQANNIKAIEF